MKSLKYRWLLWRLSRASKLVEKYGYMVVRIVQKDGTSYIRANDGSLHRIGRK